MTKLEFILALNEKLSGLPGDDVRERINFYSEMIEDRVEEGISEEDAVAAVGSVDEITTQIKAELSPVCEEKAKPKKRRIGAVEIVLLVLGFPLWFPLLIGAAAVVFSIYVSLWTVIVSLWAVFGALVGGAFSALFAGGVFTFGSTLVGIAMIGAGLVLAGLSILLFFVCRAATVGTAWLTKKTALCITRLFIKKEAV